MLFARLLRPFITLGTLHIVDASGRVHTLTGREPGPEVTMRVHSRRSQLRLLWRPALAVGEAYMDGDLTVEGGDLYPLMDLINRNIFRAGYNPLSQLQRILTWPLRLLPAANSLKRARRNAAIPMISMSRSIACSSISTCNTPAVIFARAPRRWRKRRRRRCYTWRPSSCSSPA